ncbi:MAG: LOG family protein [Phycisphaerae bacterium]|nr:LOG family protein [Phycisphaerae bacterium]
MAGEFGQRHIICVFGSYSAEPAAPLYRHAYQIGQALARAGYIVANGGYDGTMEASARGAKDAGGLTIGVTCSAFNNARGRILRANAYIDHEIHHEHLLRRIKDMMYMSSAYVVLEGGTGTLTELALVWEYVCKHLITPRPIFVFGDFWRPTVEGILKHRPKSGKYLHMVNSPEEIVRIAAGTIKGRPPWLTDSNSLARIQLPDTPHDSRAEQSRGL